MTRDFGYDVVRVICAGLASAADCKVLGEWEDKKLRLVRVSANAPRRRVFDIIGGMKFYMPSKFRDDYELMFREPLTARRFFTNVLPRGSVLMMFFGRLGEHTGLLGRIAGFLYLLMSRRRGIELNYGHIRGGTCQRSRIPDHGQQWCETGGGLDLV